MKKLVLLLVVVFAATTLIGCGKKKKNDASSMEGLNGVVSENVVSVTDSAAGTQGIADEGVPVIVENADNTGVQAVGEVAAVADVPAAGKPTSKQIQQALKNAGFYNGKVDGDIGPKTKKAISTFQAKNGLKADGKVGAKTWKALSAYLNKPTEVENPTAAAQTVGQ